MNVKLTSVIKIGGSFCYTGQAGGKQPTKFVTGFHISRTVNSGDFQL